ncbi:hypothetical protein D3C81_281910 [compost metagenome]
MQAPINEASLSVAYFRTRLPREARSWPYDAVVSGRATGSTLRSRSESVSIMAAAIQYIARQPRRSPTIPAAVRASRMPNSSPLITVPITFPCSAGLASCAARGTITCGTTVVMPIRKLAAYIQVRLCDSANPIRDTATQARSREIRPLRSRISPSGTKKSMPRA